MRGSPFIRLLIIVAVMALMFVPLRKLTSGRAAAAPAVERTTPESPVHLELTATSGRFEFVVKHLGKVVWKGEADARKVVEQDLKLPSPPEGIELGVEGEFIGTSLPAAVKLAVTPENGSTLEKVVWASGPVDEVLTFQP